MDRVRVRRWTSPTGAPRFRLYLPDGYGGGWFWSPTRRKWVRPGAHGLRWIRTYATMRRHLDQARNTRPKLSAKGCRKGWRPVSQGRGRRHIMRHGNTRRKRRWMVNLDFPRKETPNNAESRE